MKTSIIDFDDYAEMCRVQGGRCGICGERVPLVPDHNHLSKRVRGLLCKTCNLVEGHVRAKTEATGRDIPTLVARWITEDGYPDLDAELGKTVYVRPRSKFDGARTYVEAV